MHQGPLENSGCKVLEKLTFLMTGRLEEHDQVERTAQVAENWLWQSKQEVKQQLHYTCQLNCKVRRVFSQNTKKEWPEKQIDVFISCRITRTSQNTYWWEFPNCQSLFQDTKAKCNCNIQTKTDVKL